MTPLIHRCLLVGRELSRRDVDVQHILFDGSIQSQPMIEDRLLSLAQQDDLFIPRDERLAVAYRERNRKVAFIEPPRRPLIAAE
jgi:hypothetical protein